STSKMPKRIGADWRLISSMVGQPANPTIPLRWRPAIPENIAWQGTDSASVIRRHAEYKQRRRRRLKFPPQDAIVHLTKGGHNEETKFEILDRRDSPADRLRFTGVRRTCQSGRSLLEPNPSGG